ncbi:MAG: aminoacyltransferase, partial [Chloroflexota bacterium]|nr:aminoacyltransferase [Chloroflexota bacterium]
MSSPGDTASIRRDPAQWDAFVAAAPAGSFPQLTAWARANAVKGWRVSRVVLESGGGVIGAQILVHRMRPSPWSRGYAPRGPVVEGLDQQAVRDFTASVRAAGRRLRLSHLVIDPEIATGHAAESWLEREGWRRIGAIQIDRTRLVDLTRTEAELWSGLRSSARWSVNKARRTGYATEDAGEDGLDDFERMYLETARRVGFEPGAAFRAVYREFAADGAARLLLTRAPGGEAVATLVLLTCGQRITEFYGASTREGARGRANYLLKWEAIRSSRERGFASYDMWGTDQHGLAEFKAGFGGEERQYIGAWELVTDRPGRWVLDTVARGRALGGAARRRRPDPSSRTDDGPVAVAPVRVARVSASAPDGWDELTVAAPGGHV